MRKRLLSVVKFNGISDRANRRRYGNRFIGYCKRICAVLARNGNGTPAFLRYGYFRYDISLLRVYGERKRRVLFGKQSALAIGYVFRLPIRYFDVADRNRYGNIPDDLLAFDRIYVFNRLHVDRRSADRHGNDRRNFTRFHERKRIIRPIDRIRRALGQADRVARKIAVSHRIRVRRPFCIQRDVRNGICRNGRDGFSRKIACRVPAGKGVSRLGRDGQRGKPDALFKRAEGVPFSAVQNVRNLIRYRFILVRLIFGRAAGKRSHDPAHQQQGKQQLLSFRSHVFLPYQISLNRA